MASWEKGTTLQIHFMFGQADKTLLSGDKDLLQKIMSDMYRARGQIIPEGTRIQTQTEMTHGGSYLTLNAAGFSMFEINDYLHGIGWKLQGYSGDSGRVPNYPGPNIPNIHNIHQIWLKPL